jgi:hypothetical protein
LRAQRNPPQSPFFRKGGLLKKIKQFSSPSLPKRAGVIRKKKSNPAKQAAEEEAELYLKIKIIAKIRIICIIIMNRRIKV